MKILYIASSSAWGGASIALYNLIVELKEKHEILVLFPSNKGRFCDELDKIGVEYESVPYNLNIYPLNRFGLKWLYVFMRTLYRNWKARRFLYDLIHQFNPDIVHNNVGPLDISSKVCKKLGSPHVWHQREYSNLIGLYFIPNENSFRKRVLSKVNYNIAITNGVYKYLNLRQSIDTVIYDPVFDENKYKLNKDFPKDNYFLFVGRVENAKGTLDAIKAFDCFNKKNPNFCLLIAGKYNPKIFPYCKECEKYVVSHHLKDKVLFLGELPNVYELMSKAQALLVPSLFEGFGFITAEAMLNHCLVIGRNTTGTKEQFDMGLKQTGKEIGFRFMTIDEMVQSMFYVIEHDLSELRKLAFQVVLKNYSRQRHAREVEFYYNKILSEKI